MRGLDRIRARTQRAAAFAGVFAAWPRLWARADLLYPTVTDRASGSRVLVLAPHPDDDVIGCGGALRQLVQQGARIRIIYLTDGREGPAGYPDRVELVARRRSEAIAAATRLGLQAADLEFWDEPDGRLRANTATTNRMRAAFSAFDPDVVYLPFFLDPHPDHAATAEIALSAGAGTHGEVPVCAYSVLSSLVANVIVDVTAEYATKERALAEHATQVDDFPYLEAARATAELWAARFGAGRYAEAYFRASLDEHLRLLRSSRRPI